VKELKQLFKLLKEKIKAHETLIYIPYPHFIRDDLRKAIREWEEIRRNAEKWSFEKEQETLEKILFYATALWLRLRHEQKEYEKMYARTKRLAGENI